MKFTGQIRVPEIDHPAVRATLLVEDDQAELVLDGESLGRWSLYDVHARRLVASAFELDLGGEEITFLADDPIDFAYRGVEHMAEAWARFEAMRAPRRLFSVKRSRRGSVPSRIDDLRSVMESNLASRRSTGRFPGEQAPEAEERQPSLVERIQAEQRRLEREETVSGADDEPIDSEPEGGDDRAEPQPSPIASARLRDLPGVSREGSGPDQPGDLRQGPGIPEPDTFAEERRQLQLARQRLEEEKERLEKARAEAQRLEEERREALRAEAERLEEKRIAAEQLIELERQEAERLERARLEAEQLSEERENLGRARAEAQRLAEEKERLEEERRQAEQADQERRAALRAEMEHLEELRAETVRRLSQQPPAPPEVPAEEAPAPEEPSPEEEPSREEEPQPGTAASTTPERVVDLGEFEGDAAAPDPAGNGLAEPVMASAPPDRAGGLVGAVVAAFKGGAKTHDHEFVEAPGGMGMVRYICQECGYVSISVSD